MGTISAFLEYPTPYDLQAAAECAVHTAYGMVEVPLHRWL